MSKLIPGDMTQALRDISADDCYYPCGEHMSHRVRARIGLGADLHPCKYHDTLEECIPGPPVCIHGRRELTQPLADCQWCAEWTEYPY
jgi:hypothetical protein